MKKIVYFLVTIMLLSACTKTKKVVEETYANGDPKVEKYYKGEGTSKEMVKEVRYYSNKQKQMEGEYKDNKRNGDWVYYYENGNKWSEGSFADGLDVGTRTVYYENGKMRYQGKYNKGKQVGLWQFYDETGKLLKEIDFDKGGTSDSTLTK
jgi:antitoxin component YwqK of YwqJK toxin-antitoxin module